MPEIIGDGFIVKGEARVEVDFDASDLRAMRERMVTTGRQMGRDMARQFVRQMEPMNEALRDVVSPEESRRVRDRMVAAFKSGFDEIVADSARSGEQIEANMREAANAAAAALAGDVVQGTARASSATNEFQQELRELLVIAKQLPDSFNAIFGAINADIRLMAREISAQIVQMQREMQDTGVLKQQERIRAQQIKDGNRREQALLQAHLREQEQSRQSSYRTELSEHRGQQARINSVINAGLQEQLIREKGHQQTRNALIRAGLDATRSLYQAVGSGVSGAVRAMYDRLTAVTRSGEDRITAVQRSGLVRRREQTEAVMRQQVAEVRRQQGLYIAAQQRLDKGILGAAFGTSAFGAGARALTLGGGGIITALGIREAVSFETVMADVEKTVGGTAEQMAVLTRGIIEMAKTIPSTREEIAGVATVAGQLGVAIPDILPFTRVMIDLGNSTNVAAEEAADLLAKFATVTQMDPTNWERLGSTIVALGNNFAGTEADIIAMAQRIASAGALAGLTEPEIVGIANALVSVGINAEAGGTSFSTAISKMAKAAAGGKKEIAPFAEIAGQTADEFLRLFRADPGKAIADFVVGLGNIRDEGGNLFQILDDIDFKNIRISNAFRSLASSGDLFARSISTANTAWGENSALVTEASVRYATAESRFRITKNRLTDLSRQLGESIVPILLKGLDLLDPLIGGAETIIQRLGRGLRALAEDPRLETVRRALLGIAGGLVAIGAAKAAVETLRLLSFFVSGLASPMGILSIAFAGIGAVIALAWKESETFRVTVGKLRDELGRVVEVFRRAAAPVIQRFADIAGRAISKLGDGMVAIFDLLIRGDFTGLFAQTFDVRETDDIVDWILTLRTAVIDTFNAVRDYVGPAIATVIDVFRRIDLREIFSGIASVATSVFNTVRDAIMAVDLPAILERIGDIAETVRDRIVAVFWVVRDFVVAVGRTIKEVGILEGLRQAVVFPLGRLVELVKSALGKIDWGGVFAVIPAALFNVFRAIGRNVAKFVASDEFLTIVGLVLGTIATILGSAAAGLATGLVEGLAQSDLGRRVGDVLGAAFEEGIELAYSALNPINLVRKLFTEPLESGLGAAALVVEGIFAAKIVGAFSRGFSRLAATARGLRQFSGVVSGGFGAITADMNNAAAAVRNNEAAVRTANHVYGPFAGRVLRLGDSVHSMATRFSGADQAVQNNTTELAKNVDGQTRALMANQDLAKAMSPLQTAVNTTTGRFSELTTGLKNTWAQASGWRQAFSGLIAGGGLGVAIGADDLVTKLSGVSIALVGIQDGVRTTFEVMRTYGMRAALVSGGIFAAITLISTLATWFLMTRDNAKAAAEATEATSRQWKDSFRQIIEESNGSRAAEALNFWKRLNQGSDDAAVEFRHNVRELGRGVEEASRAIVGTPRQYQEWRDEVVGTLDDLEDQIREKRERIRELELAPGSAGRNVHFNPEYIALTEQVRLEEEVLEKRRQQLASVEGVRKAYLDGKDAVGEELLIVQRLREVERERMAESSKILEDRRSERDVLDDIKNRMLDLINLDKERRGEAAAVSARQAARDVAGGFKVDEETGLPQFGFDTGIVEIEDNTFQALERLRAGIGDVIADIFLQSNSLDEAKLRAEALKRELIEVFRAEGLDPTLARRIADEVVDPFINAQTFGEAFFAMINDELNTLGARLEEEKLTNLNIKGMFDPSPARKALVAFISDPSTLTVQGLLDLGVPRALLAAFIAEPSAKTLAVILNDLAARGQLSALEADLAAPVEKMIVIKPVQPGANIGYIPGGFPLPIPVGRSFPRSEYGRVVDRPMLSWLGEGNKKEVVIPLTMPRRAVELYRQSGLADVLAKGGLGAGPAPMPRGGGDAMVSGKLASLVSEVRGLRGDLAAHGSDTFIIQGNDKDEIASAIYRRRRRTRLGIR